MRNKIFSLAVLAALVTGGVYVYLNRNPDAPPYRTAKVERGDLLDTITATGNIAAVTTVSVGSQVSGTISELLADYNSSVRKGQVIARIDPRLLEAAVLQAEGTVENARSSVEKAKITVTDTERTYRRNRGLLEEGFIAQSDVDSSQTSYEQAVAQQRSAEAGLKQALGSLSVAKTNLEYATIRSPVDGVVISRDVDVGQTVAASFQTPTLFSIAQDLTKMQIDTNVDESDIGRAVQGQSVTFTVDAWPDKTFHGVVSQVRNAPIITENVVTYNVVIRVDNRDLLLKPGMTANVTILVKKYEDVLLIPSAALRYRPASEKAKGAEAWGASRRGDAGGQRVYRLDNEGAAVKVPVKAGVSNGAFTEILPGELKEGDVLILDDMSKTARPGGNPMRMGPPGGLR